MTESMIGQLTGLQEIPIPEGTEVLFGPVSNPIRRGNKQAGTVKISRKQMSREQQHTVASAIKHRSTYNHAMKTTRAICSTNHNRLWPG
jgi:hypothetical protein